MPLAADGGVGLRLRAGATQRFAENFRKTETLEHTSITAQTRLNGRSDEQNAGSYKVFGQAA